MVLAHSTGAAANPIALRSTSAAETALATDDALVTLCGIVETAAIGERLPINDAPGGLARKKRAPPRQPLHVFACPGLDSSTPD
jgi:hypothetical protein